MFRTCKDFSKQQNLIIRCLRFTLTKEHGFEKPLLYHLVRLSLFLKMFMLLVKQSDDGSCDGRVGSVVVEGIRTSLIYMLRQSLNLSSLSAPST